MKTIYNYIKPTFAWLIFMIFVNDITAQCPNNNTQWGSSAQSTTVGYTQTLTTCIYGGEYRYVYNLQAGSQYAFETCGDSDFDTQISIYDASTGAAVAYNDDYCGLQSRASFVSNGNAVRVLVDRYYCGNQSSCMTLKGTRLTGGAPPNPCNSITTLTCGNNTGSFSLTGPGAWNPPGPWGTPGAEKVFKFTATQSGAHTFNVTNSGYYVDLFVKGGSCSGSGWNFLDDVYTSASITGNLVAGVTYYFLIDDENTSASSGTFSITCPSQQVDPCASITALTCDVNSGFSLSGSGAWNPPGPWGTPGEEAVFSYTPPISGSYDVQVINSGYYVDLFYSTSCGSSGWTYVSDIYTNETNSVNLVGGVTYYFLVDDENTAANSGAINISCPCYPPAGGIDQSVIVNSNTSYSSTTVGACDDCSLRPSKDRVLEMEITCAGTYTFSTCNNATWDTYLYLTTQPCGGSIIALNDDACSLRSSITSTLAVGTYYLAIEGWSSSSQGAFTVDISKACDLSVSLAPSVVNCGYNISCNGANDGSIAATSNGCSPTYAWSNGSVDAVASGLGAGAYSVTVSDGFGCSASASATLTEPDPLVVDLSGCDLVYAGAGIEYACATIDGSANGGCQAYSYSWSNGENTPSITVCPETTTTYTLTVTDDNGCSSSESWTVTVLDISCTKKGGSSHSGSGSSPVSSGISYPSKLSGLSCNSHSHSGSGSVSGSGSGSHSSSCKLSKYSKLSGSGSHSHSGSGSGSNSCSSKSSKSGKNKDEVLMCLDGITYCVKVKHVQKRLNCGYSLGPCDGQQAAACNNTTPSSTPPVCTNCSGKLMSITLKYIGPSNQDLSVTAKKCNVSLLHVTGANTGDILTIDAASAGLQYLRKETYFELVGSSYGKIKIPTNCCDDPIGKVYFPFEVIGWVDTDGNSCGNNEGSGSRINPFSSILDTEESATANIGSITQYPNPASDNSTFEFSSPMEGNVNVTIANIKGQTIATLYNGLVNANKEYKISYNVSDLQSGIYLIHFENAQGIIKEKFVILK